VTKDKCGEWPPSNVDVKKMIQYVKKMVHIPSARIAPFFSSEKAFLM